LLYLTPRIGWGFFISNLNQERNEIFLEKEKRELRRDLGFLRQNKEK